MGSTEADWTLRGGARYARRDGEVQDVEYQRTTASYQKTCARSMQTKANTGGAISSRCEGGAEQKGEPLFRD